MNTGMMSSRRALRFPLSHRGFLSDGRRLASTIQLGLAFTLFLALFAFASPQTASAQVTFAYAQTLVNNSFTTPSAIAVDANGNLFVADSNASTITELFAADRYATPTILASSYTAGGGFSTPTGIALDAAGNVYVADYGHAAVKEILAAGGYVTVNTLGSGFTFPAHLAVDSSGNVFVSDFGNQAIEEIVAAGGYTTVHKLVSTFAPGSVAVDASGNVFFSDVATPTIQEVREIVAAGGYATVNTLASTYTAGGGFNLIEVLALDSKGNVFVGDAGSDNIMVDSSNGSVKEIPAAGGYATVNTLASSLTVPTAVATDGKGNIFFSQFSSGSISELQTKSINFGSANVCPSGTTSPAPCSIAQTLTYEVAAGTTIGSIKVLTLGAPGLDFQAQASDASTTLCKPQTYPSATTCTVDVTFAPLYAGERAGAVQIFDGSGNLLSGTSISAIGTAPAIAFTPAIQSSLLGTGGFVEPSGVATDGSGNIFVADFAKDAVYEMLAAGGYTTVNTLGGGFAFGGPSGVAVDGAGNVFVSDFTNKAIYEILAAGGYTTVNTLGGGFAFGQPSDVALDASGNLFVSDDANAVYEIPAAGGYASVIPLATSFTFASPSGLAIDGNGNVFLTDFGKDAVYEIPAAGGYTTVNQLASGFAFKSVFGIAVNASGNVFVADADFTNIFEILASDGYTTVLPVGSGFGSPQSIALDASGNVYVGDSGVPGTGIASIQVIERSQPPAISFAATNVGDTSSDSPKSVQFENSGNQLLTGTESLSDLLDFTSVKGPGVVPDCAGTLSLTPGALCNVSISFTPQSVGPLTSTLTLSDNALNGAPATQKVQFSGLGQVLQLTSISPSYGAPAAPITIIGTGFGATQGSSYVTVGGALSYVASWSNTAITILVPSRATTGNIVVTVAGVASNGKPFTFYPYPTTTGLSPLSGPIGTPVTITGTGLLDGGHAATVTFNGTPAPVISNTSTAIIVNVPIGATTGPVHVRVNGIPLNEVGTFTVTSSSLSISSISPNYGAPAAPITITGIGFGATQGSSVVTVGGAPSYVSSWSNTAITILVPSKAATGNIVVAVGGASSNGLPFTFYPYPTTTGLSPLSGPIGTPVAITGTGLLDGGHAATVTFNGTPAAILSDTSTAITVNVPAGATTGPVHVRVNGIPLNEVGTFTVTSSSLSISSISPNYGAPAAPIVITGIGFGATQGSSVVTVGGAPSYVASWSNTAITILVPSRATTGNIVVAVGGASSNGEFFTFYPYPTTTGISPLSGLVGTPVTITGTGLLDGGGNATVTFNGTPAAILSDTSTAITVNVPVGATTGPVHVRVNGIPLNEVGTFTVTPPSS